MLSWLSSSTAPLVPPEAPAWVAKLIAAAGGWGLLAVAFFDSSFGTLPVLNDLLVIWFSIQNPSHWVFYSSMATLGSVLGCAVLFFTARKGGELVLRKRASPERIERLRRWYEKNEFFTIAIPAVLPPPTPFKIFILAAGVFQVRFFYFVLALLAGRGVRYFLWGFLAMRYGEGTITYLTHNFLQVSAVAVGLILLGYLLIRVAQRYRSRGATAG